MTTNDDEPVLDGELDDDDRALGDHLRALLDPQDDLTRRTIDDVDRTLRARSALSTGLDLLGVGWWTVRAVLTDDPSGADQDVEGS